ncbi:hypothetical protein CSC68_03670 [Pseudoxanthomonas suwonensis]|nr:hypothetical protein CSC68_03670 [Pseudoxanthomonas suwonensis]
MRILLQGHGHRCAVVAAMHGITIGDSGMLRPGRHRGRYVHRLRRPSSRHQGQEQQQGGKTMQEDGHGGAARTRPR